MKHIVLYSGGANSAYTAFLINHWYHKDTILLHTPTFAEHPDSDRFRKQFADFLDLPITIQSYGCDLWSLIKKERCLPSNRIPFCSVKLKSEQAGKFYKSMTEEFIVYFGYDGTEWRRAQRSSARLEHEGIKSAYPLIESRLSGEAIKNIIRNELKICLPEPYLYLNHNNCLPCFKGGKKHFYQVWKHYPEYFAKAEKIEQSEFSQGHTVFQGTTLEKLRHEWESQVPMFPDDDDMRPCMCAL